MLNNNENAIGKHCVAQKRIVWIDWNFYRFWDNMQNVVSSLWGLSDNKGAIHVRSEILVVTEKTIPEKTQNHFYEVVFDHYEKCCFRMDLINTARPTFHANYNLIRDSVHCMSLDNDICGQTDIGMDNDICGQTDIGNDLVIGVNAHLRDDDITKMSEGQTILSEKLCRDFSAMGIPVFMYTTDGPEWYWDYASHMRKNTIVLPQFTDCEDRMDNNRLARWLHGCFHD